MSTLILMAVLGGVLGGLMVMHFKSSPEEELDEIVERLASGKSD